MTTLMKIYIKVFVFSATLCFVGCSKKKKSKSDSPATIENSDGEAEATEGSSSNTPDGQTNTPNPSSSPNSNTNPNEDDLIIGKNLSWKRAAALTVDLSSALMLSPATLCNELGLYSCTQQVHITELGSYDPLQSGTFEPIQEPNKTTPISLERVILTACTNSVYHSQIIAKKLYSDIDLSKNTGSISASAFKSHFTKLYQKILLREPADDELTDLKELLKDQAGNPINNNDFAILSCFIVASHIEGLFY
ncbi:MAG: hypothetical protein R3B45_13305 [Bdellovibrionota bacterium]